MAILARSSIATLGRVSVDSLPVYTVLRGPEAGIVMVRGRAGGSGPPFNLGEASVVRCSVQTEGGYVGHAYCLGRELRLAELAAVIDAGLQDQELYFRLYHDVIVPLEAEQAERRAQTSRRAAATQVEFFNMTTMRT